MSGAGGKGHAPRPIAVDADTYASNWDAIFGRKQDQALVESMRAENMRNAMQQMDNIVGRSSTAEQAPLKRTAEGSSPSAPAIYVDAQTGD